jgi:hypothetical protein
MTPTPRNDDSILLFRARFPTSVAFVDWLMTNPEAAHTVSYEERMSRWAAQIKQAGIQKQAPTVPFAPPLEP